MAQDVSSKKPIFPEREGINLKVTIAKIIASLDSCTNN